VDADLAPQLRQRGLDAVSVYDLNQQGLSDEAILEQAAGQQRVLLTHNIRHFVALHRQYLAKGRSHSGIVVTNERYIGRLIERVLAFASTVPAEEVGNQVRFL
jgi:hypothetical protein